VVHWLKARGNRAKRQWKPSIDRKKNSQKEGGAKKGTWCEREKEKQKSKAEGVTAQGGETQGIGQEK